MVVALKSLQNVPELSGNKNFRARDAAIFYGRTDGGFSTITIRTCEQCYLEDSIKENEHASGVNVSVASLESFCYGALLSILVLPGAKSHSSWEERSVSVTCDTGVVDVRISAPVLSLNLVSRVAIVRTCDANCLDI